MTDQPHTPTETTVRYWYIYARRASAEFNLEQVPDTSEAWAEFDRWLATVEAAAEQRGNLDGWDEALELLENNSEIDQDAVDHYKSLNPNRINRADQMVGDE